jgi:hypothetical protein
MNFGEYLKNRLAEPGWTQPAATAKAAYRTVLPVQTGNRQIGPREVYQRLVEAFGINTAAMVSAQLPIRTRRKFPIIQFFNAVDLRGKATDLSAPLSGETWQGPRSRYFSRGGHNDRTGERCLVCWAIDCRQRSYTRKSPRPA